MSAAGRECFQDWVRDNERDPEYLHWLEVTNGHSIAAPLPVREDANIVAGGIDNAGQDEGHGAGVYRREGRNAPF